MKCGKAKELYTAYRAGELTEELRAEVAAHLRECQACAAEFAALDTVVAAVRGLPPAVPPPELQRQVRKAIAQTQKSEVVEVDFVAKAKRKRTFTLSALAAAAVFCIIAVATIKLVSWRTGAPESMIAQYVPAAPPPVRAPAPAAPRTSKAAGAEEALRPLAAESMERPPSAPSGPTPPQRTTLTPSVKHKERVTRPAPLALPPSGEAVVVVPPKQPQPRGVSHEETLAAEKAAAVVPAPAAVSAGAPAAAPPPSPQGALDSETTGAGAGAKVWTSPSVPPGEKRMAVGGATGGPKGPAPPTDRTEESAYAELAVEAPKPISTVKRITVTFNGEPLDAAIRKIGKLGGLKVTVSADVKGRKVYRKFVNVPADKALREVAASAGCKVSVADGTYVVTAATATGTPQ